MLHNLRAIFAAMNSLIVMVFDIATMNIGLI